MAISFRLNDISFCFVNCHLPARAERVLNRNQDFQGLVESLGLGIKKVDIVNQFHHIFWFGDLNYRTDLPREKILQLIDSQHWGHLLANDQLIQQKQLLKTFFNFHEGYIEFPPTYRYEKGTLEWSKKVKEFVSSYPRNSKTFLLIAIVSSGNQSPELQWNSITTSQ